MPERRLNSPIKKIKDSDGVIESFGEKLLDITRLKRTETALQNAQRRLDTKNQIANIFLTIPDDEMYGEVLQVILKAMRSRYGIFGYINELGNLVIPSMTTDIWQKCKVRDKTIVFPPENWGGIWSRALKERKTLYANRDLHVPEGHIPIVRIIVVPILYHKELIGLLEVANKKTGYNEKDKSYFEILANYIAPILNARLERDKWERKHKRVEETLETANTELEMKVDERTEELQALNKHLRSMARQLSLTQARERRYIALWLHDNVNQGLSSCAMKVQALMQQVSSSDFSKPLSEIYNTIQEAIGEMRSVTSQLSPPILYEMGLEDALEELTQTFQRDYGLKCVFHTDGEPKSMDRDISVLLYGLVLELLRNVVKHAKAKRAVVELSRIGDELRITVSDDGTGLDSDIVNGSKRSKGFGLFAIREVIKDLGGRLDTEPTTSGTTIVLTVPMERKQALED
ncbi:GAF domain-containing sensor histidine kinase [Chloroflexota bacterium]